MLNVACLEKLPLVILVEDNALRDLGSGREADSGRQHLQPGPRISRICFVSEVDGTDFIASYSAMVEAVAYCRAGRGPALVHAHCNPALLAFAV